ncbi:UNVERIFIED_CONTAM: hypothetical protein NCL1_19061 [Trichonephila clavipes]
MYMSAKFPDLERTLLQIIEEDVKISKTKRKTPNGPYPSTLHIFDMEGLTFANATDKKGIEYMILGLTIFQNHYPVLIGSVYVINTLTSDSLLLCFRSDDFSVFLVETVLEIAFSLRKNMTNGFSSD